MLKHGILGLLNYGEMTGYEIRETFRHSLAYFWQAQSSQIYRELHEMEKLGWITSTKVAQTGKPDKNVCRITPAGRQELRRWLDEKDTYCTRSPLLMKVFFLGERSDEENAAFFRAMEKETMAEEKGLESAPGFVDFYQRTIEDPAKARYWQMTIDYGRRMMKATREWARACAKELEKKEGEKDEDSGC